MTNSSSMNMADYLKTPNYFHRSMSNMSDTVSYSYNSAYIPDMMFPLYFYIDGSNTSFYIDCF